jgi:DeoR/GlpR family transcriptional regulator of sugar metabolism
MLPHQRHLDILRTLDRQGAVKVSETAHRLNVTEETIRRDLDKLEEEGLLARTHGGAVPRESFNQPLPYSAREVSQVEEKRKIAKLALAEIEEGDAVFLDGSTTAYQLARVFPDIRCTVLTHSEPILAELASRTNIELLSTGGLYDRRSASFVGPLAEQMLSLCQINKVFMGCKGLDFKRGLSDASVRHMNLKRSVTHWAEKVYIMADHSKFDVRSRFFFASLQDIHVIITDRPVQAPHEAALRKAGVKVVC